MSTTMQEIEQAVHRVPIWGWGALAGGAVLIVLSRHNKTAAAITDPNAATPDLTSGVIPSGGSGAIYDPGYTSPGTTPDPGTTGPAPPPTAQKFTDILGGSIAQFVAGLPVAPNDLSFTDAYGQTFHESNDENALFYAAQMQGNTNFFQALQALIAQGPSAWGSTDWGWLFGHMPVTGFYPSENPTPKLPPGSPPAQSPGGGRGAEHCANGDTACIRARCNHGDTACAQAAAPWWNGSPIAGWS